LPFRNAALQFVAGALLLIFGLSLGREGPSVHLGAASGSLLGQWARIPHNSLRTLVGCGAAAAISASFNTPLAGVVFAMEVVLMEYTIDGFTPVILAAVSGAALGHLAYGDAPTLGMAQLTLHSMWELPYIIAMGVVIGAFAAAFIVLVRTLTRHTRLWPWWLRMVVAGVLVGGCGMAVPQVMGIGYDTVNLTLAGKYAIGTLAAIAAVKLIATAIGIGARLPGGLIGPTLVMGAAAGGVLGYIGTGIVPGNTSEIGLYAMLGMGAMMGATLQAPLAALLALLELTGNPNIILPGMLAIVSATLAAKELFRCESVFAMQMRELGLDHSNDPVAQQLRRIGVAAVMSGAFRTAPTRLPAKAAAALLTDTPQWIIVSKDDGKVLLPAADLARHLESEPAGEVDLLDMPGHRRRLASIHPEATLQAGLDALERAGAEALYVESTAGLQPTRILGVLTLEQIEASYRYRPPVSPSVR
jgi:CIC family chloride channel protein